MKRNVVKHGIHLAVITTLVGAAALARADAGTLELGIGTAYTRGVGEASAPMPALQHLAGDGGTLRLDFSWRFDPRWALGCYYEGALFAGGHLEGSGDMRSFAAGMQGRFHTMPSSKLDPWFGVGAGWRGIRLDHGTGTHAMQGLDLARIQVGVDYHAARWLSVAPTIGVAVTELLEEKRPGETEYSAVDDRKISAFLFAGLSGRVDVFGRRTAAAR